VIHRAGKIQRGKEREGKTGGDTEERDRENIT
jgi:hypothetical protein